MFGGVGCWEVVERTYMYVRFPEPWRLGGRCSWLRLMLSDALGRGGLPPGRPGGVRGVVWRLKRQPFGMYR